MLNARPKMHEHQRHVVILAPNHADVDRRVLRTVSAFLEFAQIVDVFWDGDYPGHCHEAPTRAGRAAHFHYLDRGHGRLAKGLLLNRCFSRDLETRIRQADCIYIHASGIEGLVYARCSRKLAPHAKIIFDYHDSFTFEVHYQLKKRYLARLFPALWPIFPPFLAQLGKNLNGLVGISNGQVAELLQWANLTVPYTYMPNLSALHPDLSAARYQEDQELSFTWIGQILNGYDLEDLSLWIKSSFPQQSFHVIGGTKNEEPKHFVANTLNNRALFYGAFKGIEHLASMIPHNAVGLFLGWDDPSDTNVNGIASPNKFFSYVDLEIPIIIGKRLTNLTKEVERFGAGIAVETEAEFAAAAKTIQNDYLRFHEGMKKLKSDYIERNYEKRLKDWLENHSFKKSSTSHAPSI